MKKELKSGILSADKSADCRPTVGGVNVIAVLHLTFIKTVLFFVLLLKIDCGYTSEPPHSMF